MKKVILALVLTAPLAACDATQAGLAGGAVLGAALDDDNPARGAVVGAAVGGVTGAVVDQNRGVSQ